MFIIIIKLSTRYSLQFPSRLQNSAIQCREVDPRTKLRCGVVAILHLLVTVERRLSIVIHPNSTVEVIATQLRERGFRWRLSATVRRTTYGIGEFTPQWNLQRNFV